MAPTDPVLASSVVTGHKAEEVLPGRARQLLSLESAANDGLALLFVMAGFVAVTGRAAEHWLQLRLGWRGLAFVAGVLALGRLPVVLAMRRPLRLSTADAIWLGWFGPIGIAALFYLTYVAERGVEHTTVSGGNPDHRGEHTAARDHNPAGAPRLRAADPEGEGEGEAPAEAAEADARSGDMQAAPDER